MADNHLTGEHAARFMKLNATFDKLPRAQVRTALKKAMKRVTTVNKKARCKMESTLLDSRGGSGSRPSNPRITIPAELRSAIQELKTRGVEVSFEPSDRSKVPHSWLVCYVNDILPDTAIEGWQSLQCSHRCINAKCVTPRHIVWETASENQSRGNKTCRRACVHEGCPSRNVCSCQGFHQPPCI